MPTVNIRLGCFRATSKLQLVLLTFFAWSGFDKPYLFTGVFLQGYYFIQNFYNSVLSTVSHIIMSFCSLGLGQNHSTHRSKVARANIPFIRINFRVSLATRCINLQVLDPASLPGHITS